MALARMALKLVVIVELMVLALTVVGSLISAPPTDGHSEVASAVYAGLGVIFGVMLAQLVVVGWSDYQTARVASFREAAALRNLVRLADGFAPPQRQAMLEAAEEYARAVLDDEWPKMQTGRPLGPRADTALHDLFRLVITANMSSAYGGAYLDAAIGKLENLSDARAERLAALRSGLPNFMWGVLIAQALLVVGFVEFFDVEGSITYHGMIVALITTIALLLALVWVLDNPYTPPSGITPDEFHGIVQLIQQELESENEHALN